MKTQLEFIVWCLMDEIVDPHLKRNFTTKERATIKEANQSIHEKQPIRASLVRKLERIWRKDYYSEPKIDDEEDHTEIE